MDTGNLSEELNDKFSLVETSISRLKNKLSEFGSKATNFSWRDKKSLNSSPSNPKSESFKRVMTSIENLSEGVLAGLEAEGWFRSQTGMLEPIFSPREEAAKLASKVLDYVNSSESVSESLQGVKEDIERVMDYFTRLENELGDVLQEADDEKELLETLDTKILEVRIALHDAENMLRQMEGEQDKIEDMEETVQAIKYHLLNLSNQASNLTEETRRKFKHRPKGVPGLFGRALVTLEVLSKSVQVELGDRAPELGQFIQEAKEDFEGAVEDVKALPSDILDYLNSAEIIYEGTDAIQEKLEELVEGYKSLRFKLRQMITDYVVDNNLIQTRNKNLGTVIMDKTMSKVNSLWNKLSLLMNHSPADDSATNATKE